MPPKPFPKSPQQINFYLHEAIEKLDIEAVKKAIGAGADVNKYGEDGSTPLKTAILWEFLEAVEALLNSPEIDINKLDEFGNSALDITCFYLNFPIIKLLLEHPKINPISSKQGWNNFFYTAAFLIQLLSYESLLEEQDYRYDILSKLKTYLTVKELSRINIYKKKYSFQEQSIFNINQSEKFINTAFHIVIEELSKKKLSTESSKQITKYLLKNLNTAKKNINTQNEAGDTPLHLAVTYGNIKLIEFLSALAELDINTKNKEGNSALHLAIASENIGAVNTLLKTEKINLHIENQEGNTPLHFAAAYGNIKNLEFLLAKVTRGINAKNMGKNTPLHLAIAYGNTEIVKTLLNKADINIYKKNAKGNTPLHLAVLSGNKELAELLLKKSYTSIENNEGNTPLHIAAELGNTKIVEFILKKSEGNINVQNNKGNTPLHLAAASENNEIVKFLSNLCEIDPNIQNKEGNTSLHLAIKSSHHTAAKILSENKNINLYLKNNKDQTPCDIFLAELNSFNFNSDSMQTIFQTIFLPEYCPENFIKEPTTKRFDFLNLIRAKYTKELGENLRSCLSHKIQDSLSKALYYLKIDNPECLPREAEIWCETLFNKPTPGCLDILYKLFNLEDCNEEMRCVPINGPSMFNATLQKELNNGPEQRVVIKTP